MRVIYLHQYFNTPDMEGSTRSYEMGRRLVSYGHSVEMITSYRKASNRDRRSWFITYEDGMRVHWIPLPYSNKMSYKLRIKAFLKFAWQATLRASSLKADLVFASSTPLTIAIPGVIAAKKQRIPMVFEVRDIWPKLPIAIGAIKNPLLKWAAKKFELFAYKNSEQIVALSPEMKDSIRETGYPSERITVIPNGCDLALFDRGREKGRQLRKKYHWIGEKPLVIYAGTVGIINGVDYLARVAYAALEIDPEIRFLILGSGRGEGKLLEEAVRLGVFENNLYIMPGVPKREMGEWLSAADLATSLFVNLEEMWANSANKFFDALAAAKPVAINYGGWQAEIIKNYEAGLVLDPLDEKGAAKMLANKLRDKEWLTNAGLTARKIAEKHFERGKLAKDLEEVLLKSLKHSD